MLYPAGTLLLIAALALPLHAQSVRLKIGSGSRITVSGTSNVHDWKCSTTAFTAAIMVPRGAPGELASEVESVTLAIPVSSLDCGNGQMNTNLRKAMNADRHPTIGYRMVSYTARPSAGGYQGTLRGSLTINGVTRPVSLTASGRPDGKGSVRADGRVSFSTRDFGIEPVKAMLGTIRTGERVTITVSIIGSAPVPVVAARAAPAPVVAVAPPSRPAPAAVARPVTAAVPRKATVVPPAASPAPRTDTVVAQAVALLGDSIAALPKPMVPVIPSLAIAEPTRDRTADTIIAADAPGDVVPGDSLQLEDAAPAGRGVAESPADSVRRFALPARRIQHLRPRDQRGLLVFESPKQDTVSYQGFTMQWGGAFTQEAQALHHENTAQAVLVGGVNRNQLMDIGGGFNNAVANLYFDAQLADGIRVALTSYLSSRHHSETWVKDGYFLIDASPIPNPLLDLLMQLVTVKVGHFEINYGDAHFRRSDNGHSLHNPLVGNLILDAFTTEIGAEGYARLGDVFAMGGLTGGEIRGQVTGPERRSPAWLAKVGLDRQMAPDLRVRITGSTYGTAKSRSNTLYTGDRAGSPYFMVVENTLATEAANAWSGNMRPGFTNVVHAYMMNPFVKYRDLEFFGTIETATGKAATELRKRTMRQLAGEGVARFGSTDQLYAAARYNTVSGQLAGMPSDITTDRWQAGGGWFVLPTVLAKVEYVVQRYHGFPATDIRSGARFSGFMFAGALAF